MGGPTLYVWSSTVTDHRSFHDNSNAVVQAYGMVSDEFEVTSGVARVSWHLHCLTCTLMQSPT